MRGSEASGSGVLLDTPTTLTATATSLVSYPSLPPSLSATLFSSDPGSVAQFDLAASSHRTEVGDVKVGTTGSTGKGILIGILSAFGSAGVAVVVLAVFFFFKYTQRGRIILDRIGRPGEYDDEQAFLRDEAAALETMDELSRTEYLRAKGTYVQCPDASRVEVVLCVHSG